jgi:hypothetical protein
MEAETSLTHSQSPSLVPVLSQISPVHDPDVPNIKSILSSWFLNSLSIYLSFAKMLFNSFRKKMDYRGGDVNCSALSTVHPLCISFFLSFFPSFLLSLFLWMFLSYFLSRYPTGLIHSYATELYAVLSHLIPSCKENWTRLVRNLICGIRDDREKINWDELAMLLWVILS